ncbi:MAG: alpha-N-acetylglucosaminidase TIM-barrel domain-containing protein, partial [bacterium]
MRPRYVLAWAVVLSLASQAYGLQLVREGKPVARIVVAEGAPRVERFAATRLQSVIAEISGARLPVGQDLSGKAEAWVLIGEGAARLAGEEVLEATSFDEVQHDGYVAATVEAGQRRCLVLAGKEPRGTLFSVCNLLETVLSCGFFSDGERFPRRRDVAIDGLRLVGSPAFPLRACWVPTRYYGPKRFQATLWNAEDWKRFLRWMAAKKMNCLAVEFSGDTRGWGEAFDQAFPEARKLKRPTLPPPDQPPVPGPTVNLGWGLHPHYQSELWKEVFAYARQTLGLRVLYILHVGEFELPLKLAKPDLKWMPAAPRDFIGVAGESPVLSPTDPQFAAVQSRLWQTLIATYGTDHLYAIDCHGHRGTAGSLRGKANPVLVASRLLRKLDPEAQVLVTAADSPFWGDTQEEQTAFLERLPDYVSVLYTQDGFPGDALYRATDRFAGKPFHYASLWGEAGADLLEYCFDPLRTQSYHMGLTPAPDARGYFHWAELRGSNPLMDNLASVYAWTGRNTWRSEGGSNNPQTRFYLGRRYTPSGWWQIAEAYKQTIQDAPRGNEAINYRAYIRWADVTVRGTTAARAGVALMLGCKKIAHASPYYQGDLVDFGRNYLHQYLEARYAD